ncbi:hypothetical protein ABBQ32_007677 [Trebouxia sp. C0010 RCD-2024]
MDSDSRVSMHLSWKGFPPSLLLAFSSYMFLVVQLMHTLYGLQTVRPKGSQVHMKAPLHVPQMMQPSRARQRRMQLKTLPLTLTPTLPMALEASV